MKKAFASLAVVITVLFASMSYAQSCGTVSDEAGKISNPSSVSQGASALSNQGIDAHLITVPSIAKYGVRAEDVLNAYLRRCPSWSKSNGERNYNLLVTVVSFSPKISAETFFGRDLNKAFAQGQSSAILKSSAGPSFHNQQYGEGIGKVFSNYANVISAYRVRASAPPSTGKQTTVINQATDPETAKANASVWKWFFFLLFLAVGGVIVFMIFRKRSADREEAGSAQQDAQEALQTATRLFRGLSADNPQYLEISSYYQTLTNSVSYDPNTTGLSASQYATMAKAWNNLSSDIRSATRGTSTPASTPTPTASAVSDSQTMAAAAGAYSSAPYSPAPTAPTPSYQPSYQQPTVIHEHHTTYVERDSSGDMLTGMLVGEAIANNNRDEYEREREVSRYDRPEYSAPSRDSVSMSASRDDDDSNNGSSGSVSFDDDSSNNDNSSSYDDSSSNDDNSGDSGSTDF